MAVVHQSSATGTAGSGATSLTINKPTGTAANDVLIAAMTLGGGAHVSTPPTGWVVLVGGGASDTYGAYYKIAGGAEPASYTWTLDAAGGGAGGISRYSGVDNGTPLDVAATSAFGLSGTAASVGPITTTTNNAMVVGGVFEFQVYTVTPPASLTERWEAGPSNNVGNEHASGVQASAGSTGTLTWTLSTSGVWTAWAAALHDANAAQTVISPVFVDTSTQVFAPAVVGNSAIVAGFVPSSAAVFAPTVSVTSGPQTVTPSFVGSTAQVFAPSLTQTGTLARVHAMHQSAISVVVDHEPL